MWPSNFESVAKERKPSDLCCTHFMLAIMVMMVISPRAAVGDTDGEDHIPTQ